MKRIYKRDSRLESHPLFPYIAWITIILFAVFVMNLIMSVEKRIVALEERTANLQYQYQIDASTATASTTVTE